MNNKLHIAPLIARRIFGTDLSELDAVERRVLDHIEARRPIAADVAELVEKQGTLGDRVADSVARMGGSWGFIAIFFIFLFAWVVINSVILLSSDVFDPYPYVFLNLCLSMLAAIQAPIIMMSQNRQAEKDRIAASHDYEVNLRSEIEILAVQEKLDRLRGEQHEKILAQQEEILSLLRELRAAGRLS